MLLYLIYPRFIKKHFINVTFYQFTNYQISTIFALMPHFINGHVLSAVASWQHTTFYLIVLASFYEYNYIKKLFNFLQPPFPCSKYLSTTIKFYPVTYFPQILTIYMLVHRAGYALFLPRHHVIRGTIMWPLSSKKMREGDIRYWHSTAAPNTVLKSRTFSIVNPWVYIARTLWTILVFWHSSRC